MKTKTESESGVDPTQAASASAPAKRGTLDSPDDPDDRSIETLEKLIAARLGGCIFITDSRQS